MKYPATLSLAAAFVLPIANDALAQKQEPARFEILAGVSPAVCAAGCAAIAMLDGGVTGWINEHFGVSGRVRSLLLTTEGTRGDITPRPEALFRFRRLLKEGREVDFGIGRRWRWGGDWKTEVLFGFKIHDRVGVKIGAEYYAPDHLVLVNFLVAIRPGHQ